MKIGKEKQRLLSTPLFRYFLSGKIINLKSVRIRETLAMLWGTTMGWDSVPTIGATIYGTVRNPVLTNTVLVAFGCLSVCEQGSTTTIAILVPVMGPLPVIEFAGIHGMNGSILSSRRE